MHRQTDMHGKTDRQTDRQADISTWRPDSRLQGNVRAVRSQWQKFS